MNGSTAANANSSSLSLNNNNNNCTSSRWLTEEVFRLIQMVQQDEAIYNPRHKYYFCRPYVENFWREVDLKLEKNPGASLAKWTNLRISFRREYTNYLEEKVAPCWSYFDRMFFLHPYLRKKHQQPKSLDSQVQDALVQISTLSNRLQREKAFAAAASASLASSNGRSLAHHHHHQPLDNYLDYYDEPDPLNSELDEIIDDDNEQQSRFPNNGIHHSDIKSECDDPLDEYEPDARNDLLDDDDHDDREDSVMHLDDTERRHQMRMQHLNRLQTRSYHDEMRAKRPRSQDSISSTHTHNPVSLGQGGSSGYAAKANFAKPSTSMELVSTTTTAASQPATQNESELLTPTSSVGIMSAAATTTSTSTSIASAAASNSCSSAGGHNGQQRHNTNLAAPSHPYYHHHHQQQHQLPPHQQHRLDLSVVSPVAVPPLVPSTAPITPTASVSVGNGGPGGGGTHLELCDCKTDPDAMFLMSLLPDIQKLNGRDRGKIKIAFQNILQDYLYPD